MRKYKISFKGETPLLVHNDNIQWAEVMKKWGMDPANKKMSIPGDDRTPAWRWLGCLYVESGKVVMSSDNLMTLLREGGKKVSTGKRQQTFKSITQSGLVVDQSAWPITVNGSEIPYAPLKALIEDSDFEHHEQVCANLGFMLFVKRAKIGQAKHVRVRPRFDNWAISGTLTALDDMLTHEVIQTILDQAGLYVGLGDWRPSSPASGPYGKFTPTVEEL